MVVDASVWIGVFRTGDAHHVASRAWMATQTRAGMALFAPLIALPEVAGPIARITGRRETGLRATRRLLETPGIRLVDLDRRLMSEALILAARLRLRGADAVYVAVARRFHVPLVTWDQQLAERAAPVVQVLHP